MSPTPPFVRTTLDFEEVASTSDLARQLAADAPHELPLLVRARRQTRGRGRGSNAWWSDEGSLLFSLLLDPARHGLRPEHEPRLALVTALAAVEAIAPHLPDPGVLGIRWPNDVEAGGLKLGGILPERVETGRGPRLVIGVGLNLSTRLDAAPAAVRAMATSVEALRGRPLPPDDAGRVLIDLLAHLAEGLEALGRDDPALAARWDRLDTLRGVPVRIDLGPRLVEGSGAGIDDRGGLRLRTAEGPLTLFGGRVLRDPAP